MEEKKTRIISVGSQKPEAFLGDDIYVWGSTKSGRKYWEAESNDMFRVLYSTRFKYINTATFSESVYTEGKGLPDFLKNIKDNNKGDNFKVVSRFEDEAKDIPENLEGML